jgi:pyruvate/2-oxoglutarate dehydrogenase complex dihydrolipoamide acyltransferase (E2) component
MFHHTLTFSTPIINQPETIIVQPGAILDRPWVIEGELAVRPVVPLSVTFDHRVVDGAPVGKFYNAMAEMIENPDYLIL